MSDLSERLSQLIAPGTKGTTLPGTVRRAAPTYPRGWEPGVKYEPTGAMLVTTPGSTEPLTGDEAAWQQMVEDLGLAVPDGWRVRLVEAKYDPAAWHRDAPGDDAVTRPVWRFRFACEPDTRPGALGVEDIDALVRDAMQRQRPPRTPPATVDRALVVVYADPQTGKVGSGGGSAELVQRVADRFDRLEDHVRDLHAIGRGPNAAYWLDAGDGLENFDNVTSQAFTNDLSLTQQMRLYRRLTFEGLDRLSGAFDRVVAAVCGSNHAQVRRGKDAVGPPSNDYGIEVLSQVQDAYSRNPDRYGHVSFVYPDEWKETLALDVAGTVVGLAHGHQVARPEKTPDWWRGQAFGAQPVTHARILVTGHFHHFRALQLGDGRLWVATPTLDNGSDWYSQRSGEVSVPGMLVFSVGPDGWDDLRIL